ncbi:hypothetical protein [Saccharothrix lopnurensis]|uniref:Uncharacterized protein n=1 Tax=Saccharothrix lopnurensis TaxID=1670621 RepID=A0ABW1NXG8_9PSEU
MSTQGWNGPEVSAVAEPRVAACTPPTAERSPRVAGFDGPVARAGVGRAGR